ncbi:MAG: S10 family peptidase [Caulobacteraceae bacterium]
MRKVLPFVACVCLIASAGWAAETPRKVPTSPSLKPEATSTASPNRGLIFAPESVASQGAVSVEGQRIDYRAIAGTIVVHPKGWDDVAAREHPDLEEKHETEEPGEAGEDKNPKAEASMFYVAYFKKGVPSTDRPITFLYNGGPGSSTVWLHMGAFGPRRVLTRDDSHTPAAPYRLVDNAYSLLDVSDLVFVDAPGTGFSRIAGKDKEKSFYGVDPDAYAFGQFILGFLSEYGRWNSPKYLFGESYGTPRSAVLINELETGHDVDFNGVILLSQILNFDLSADGPEFNPGSDEAYVTALPTYAATAWYHNRLAGPRPADLEAFLAEVERFATTDYAVALGAGSELDPARRQAIAERLAAYTGLPVDYVLKADLRINGGEFEKNLQDPEGLTTGRLDTRFSGPTIDPLSKESDYDPQSAAISSAYVSAFNDYVRKELGFGEDRIYKPEIQVGKYWSFEHQPPGAEFPIRGILNVMPDLAYAMKYNPDLKVMVNGGYFDLATPFYEGWYEMHHMQLPAKLQANIEYHYFQSGHMVYAHEASLKALHDAVADFIRRTDNLGR